MNFKKAILIFGFAVILCLCFKYYGYCTEIGDTETSNEVDIQETGNDITSASTITPNNIYSLKIDAPGDKDFFKINIDKHMLLEVYTWGSTDTYGELLNEDGSNIILNDDSGSEKNFAFQLEVNPGTYYISVRDYYEDRTGDYLLFVYTAEVREDEYGNDMEHATPVEVPLSSYRNMLTPGDIDYIKINMVNCGWVSVYTSGVTDTYGVLQDEQGNILEEDDDSSAGKNFTFERVLVPGIYYIRITDFYPEKGGIYDLNISITQIDDDYGNFMENAAEININESISGKIDYGRDIDFFKFNIDAPMLIEAFSSGITDTYGTIYNSDGQAIIENDDDGEMKNFDMTVQVDPGIYYISVRNYYDFLAGDYSVTVNQKLIQEDDYGNTIEDAAPIEVESVTAAGIQTFGDVDYFKFTVDKDYKVVIMTTGNTDTFGSLYNENGILIEQEDDTGIDKNFYISRDLTPGVYYIEVRDYYPYKIGDYSLELYLTSSTPEVPATP